MIYYSVILVTSFLLFHFLKLIKGLMMLKLLKKSLFSSKI